MKYIRTKDGRIIGFNPYDKDLDLVEYLSHFVNYQGECAPFKQADVIEELCDLFAFELVLGIKPEFFTSYSEAKKSGWEKVGRLVGFVLVEKKGVKTFEPVAVTNEKGELELL